MGEKGAPLIDSAKVPIECEVDGHYEWERFDQFMCKILATYADDSVLNEKGRLIIMSSSRCFLNSQPMNTLQPVNRLTIAER